MRAIESLCSVLVFLFRFLDGHAVQEIRVDHAAVLDVRLVTDGERGGIRARRRNHWEYRQVILTGELEVALIVRDIEAKVKIYADLFGVEIPAIIETAPESEAHTRYQGEPTEARAKLAFFDMGSLTLELIEPRQA